MSQTEIQRVFDFLETILVPNPPRIVQGYTLDDIYPPKDMARTPCVAIQLVTSAPNAAPWGHIISYTPHLNTDPPTATLVMGHNHKALFKIHCISYLSFDQADVIADLVAEAFHDYSPYINRNRPVVMKSHGIIKVVDGPRKTPIPPFREPEFWKVVVDINLEIQRVETYSVTPITKWQNFNQNVNGFLKKIVRGHNRFAHPETVDLVLTENDPEVDIVWEP